MLTRLFHLIGWGVKLSVMESLKESVKACETFSNIQRSLIALVIDKYGQISWSDLKTEVEKIKGPMNPNTLSFHLKKLQDENIISHGGTDKQPIYFITDKGKVEVGEKLGKVRDEIGGKRDEQG
jgi:DNA-binding PadR family transcriptional regulator